MKKEQLVRSVIGCILILALGFVTYTLMKHSEQTESMTQNESTSKSEVTGTDGWEVESTVATEGLRAEDGVTHNDSQGVPDLSKVENSIDSPINGKHFVGDYRTFKNSHVPYSRNIADVFPVIGTPAYKLEFKWSDQDNEDFKELFDEYDIGCPSDHSVTIALTKFDPRSKRYIPIVDDLCFLADGLLFNRSYPVWSRDERYVALVDERTFTFDIFNPETTQKLSFIDTKNLQEGVQDMSSLGLGYSYDPELAFNFSTVRKTEDGHIQVIGIGTWDYKRDGYVFVFDFTDWSLKEILHIEPNDDVLLGAEWAGERVVRVYTIPTFVVKECEHTIGDPIYKRLGGKVTNQYPPEYYSCRKINVSSFMQMKTHTIPF
jgi:hypothetical protein